VDVRRFKRQTHVCKEPKAAAARRGAYDRVFSPTWLEGLADRRTAL
jgi:hypothetical protein